jgi:hypothetical protein
MLIGPSFHHKVSKHRVSMTVAMCLVAVIFARSGHVAGFPRVWSDVLLSAVMTASAGICLAVSYLAGVSLERMKMLE